ncbi:MAG: HypC/HybG/HupF family hydrogenase formation chaperone [Deltaproteobacteria bacterium]|nr:HypC/HybG/HupF family hydrogenase formation chaperone [Deltaproteobacteria bacterium]
MCLAIPARVLTVDGLEGEVELSGVVRRASFQLLPETRAGDWVLLHAGFAIAAVDEEEARDTLALFRSLEAGSDTGGP